MEIQNASTTPSKSNQLRNVNTVRWYLITRSNEGGGYKTNGNILKILIEYIAVYPTAFSEKYFLSGMLTILLKTQAVSISNNIFQNA